MDIRRRTRFSRDIPLRNGKRNGFNKDETEMSGILSDLGSKLATFKASPSFSDGLYKPSRPFFIGACEYCCPHSRATLGTERAIPIQGLENVFSYNQWYTGQKILLKDSKHSDTPKLYPNEKEFESKVMHSKRRSIEKVLMLNDDYNSLDINSWFRLMELKLNIVSSWMSKVGGVVVEWILRKIFPYGIIFHPGQIAVIKRALVSENPLVFLPVKQSSMDSVIVQRLLSKEFKLPTIQVKESFENDCYLPWLWNLFQNAFSNGNFRLLPSNEQMASDLVWAVQQEVIQSLLEDKSNLIMPLNPYKVNYDTVKREEHCQFLSSLIEVLQSSDSSVMDVNIVPMSLTYDLKFENLSDWTISSSEKGFLSNVFNLLPFLINSGRSGCGKVRVDFDQPFSLREFINNAEKYNDNSNDYDAERYTQSLCNHLVWNSFNLRRFSACDIYSFSKFNLTHQNLVSSITKVVTDMKAKNRDFAYAGEPLHAMNYALKFDHRLKGKINLAEDLLPVYFGEMVMSSAVCALLNTSALSCYKNTHAHIRIESKQALIEEAKLLINLVEYEFPGVAPPCKDKIDEFLMETFDNFVVKGMLIEENRENRGSVSQHMQARKSRQIAKHLELDCPDAEWDDNTTSYNQVRIGLSGGSIDELIFFRNLFARILSPYLYVVDKLKTLVDIEYVSVEEFQTEFKNLADEEKSRISVILSRFEAMKVFESAITEYKERKNVRVMWLTEEWNSNRILDDLLHRIFKYVSL